MAKESRNEHLKTKHLDSEIVKNGLDLHSLIVKDVIPLQIIYDYRSRGGVDWGVKE